jgi:hypothetical protein
VEPPLDDPPEEPPDEEAFEDGVHGEGSPLLPQAAARGTPQASTQAHRPCVPVLIPVLPGKRPLPPDAHEVSQHRDRAPNRVGLYRSFRSPIAAGADCPASSPSTSSGSSGSSGSSRRPAGAVGAQPRAPSDGSDGKRVHVRL